LQIIFYFVVYFTLLFGVRITQISESVVSALDVENEVCRFDTICTQQLDYGVTDLSVSPLKFFLVDSVGPVDDVLALVEFPLADGGGMSAEQPPQGSEQAAEQQRDQKQTLLENETHTHGNNQQHHSAHQQLQSLQPILSDTRDFDS